MQEEQLFTLYWNSWYFLNIIFDEFIQRKLIKFRNQFKTLISSYKYTIRDTNQTVPEHLLLLLKSDFDLFKKMKKRLYYSP